jgi:hypothetical protein
MRTAMGPGVWGFGGVIAPHGPPLINDKGEMSEASRGGPVKAEPEPATWPTAMAESKRISP